MAGQAARLLDQQAAGDGQLTKPGENLPSPADPAGSQLPRSAPHQRHSAPAGCRRRRADAAQVHGRPPVGPTRRKGQALMPQRPAPAPY
jgi:hypothetical protein